MASKSINIVALLAVCLAGSVSASLPPAAQVLANGEKACSYYIEHASKDNCGWERGTFMLGLIEFYKVTKNESLLEFAKGWADKYDYQLCANGEEDSLETTDAPHGVKNANNQLCGATYVELYKLSGMKNKTMLDATIKEFDYEISNDADTKGYWSWVDALFMAMNTWARIGQVTGESKYLEKMNENFNVSSLVSPSNHGYQFWSQKYHLFYRDDRFLNSTTFWSRGNGWAMGALVAAIENSPAGPAQEFYKDVLKMQAAELKKVQGSDGMWRSSILNATGYPSPEATGSSLFTFGIAYGINKGILPTADYMPVVEKAYEFLSTKSLHESGLFGYCQPVGGSPEHNITPNSTSDFCVGQFLLASTEVSKLTK